MAAATSRKIAIVGAGPCGVLTSRLVRQRFPDAVIDLFEREPVVGGNASSVMVEDCRRDGSVKSSRFPRLKGTDSTRPCAR